MTIGAHGLVAVATSDLEKLLRALVRGHLACPLTVHGLACVGLQHAADRLDAVKNLPEPAVRAVIVAVVAERRAAARREASLRQTLEAAGDDAP